MRCNRSQVAWIRPGIGGTVDRSATRLLWQSRGLCRARAAHWEEVVALQTHFAELLEQQALRDDCRNSTADTGIFPCTTMRGLNVHMDMAAERRHIAALQGLSSQLCTLKELVSELSGIGRWTFHALLVRLRIHGLAQWWKKCLQKTLSPAPTPAGK